MSICIVEDARDVVIVVEEECTRCTDRKLGVLVRYPLSSDPLARKQQIGEFIRKTEVPPEITRALYKQKVDDVRAWNLAHPEKEDQKPDPDPYVGEQKLTQVRSRCDHRPECRR